MRSQIHAARFLFSAPLLALTACAPERALASDVTAELKFEPAPYVGEVWLGVELADADGQPISGAELELEGNMNHAGMVPVFADPLEVAAGRYESAFQFTMGGDWLMTVRGTLPDGRALEQTLEISGVPTDPTGTSCCITAGSVD